MMQGMATADKKTVLVGGANGGHPVVPGNILSDLERAQDVARRYRCEFVDLTDFQLHHELFKKLSPELMFRYKFVPLEETSDGRLAIAIADPSQLMMIDEISLLLQKRIVTKVATLKQIDDILKKTEQSQRVLEEASEGFTIVREDEATGAEESRPRAAMTVDELIAAQRLVRRLPVGESVVEAILNLVRSARPGSSCPVASMRPSVPTRIWSPTWCGACWRSRPRPGRWSRTSSCWGCASSSTRWCRPTRTRAASRTV